MTIEEFDKQKWAGGMTATMKETRITAAGETFDIGSVDFEEKLIGLNDPKTDELRWVRCENVESVS